MLRPGEVRGRGRDKGRAPRANGERDTVEARSSCSMARDFHEHSSPDASSARSPSIETSRLRFSSRRRRRGSVHLLAAACAFSTCLAHPRPRSLARARVPHHDSYGPARGNTSSAAEVPFNLPNPDLRAAPRSPRGMLILDTLSAAPLYTQLPEDTC